jgi:hypothetical protein
MKVSPGRIVSIYIALVILLALAHIIGIYVPETAEEGEFYIPYMYVSGPLVWFAALRLTLYTKLALSLHLSRPLGPLLWVVIVPGLYNILLGSLQWYGITWGVVKLRAVLRAGCGSPPPESDHTQNEVEEGREGETSLPTL